MTKNTAVFNSSPARHSRLLATLLALLGAAVLLASLGGTAEAAKPIGKGGSIQACYKVKGKPKGSIRVVPTGKRCKRGERKLLWSSAGAPGSSVTGGAGSQGAQGQGGGGGSNGGNGNNGANGTGTVTALETKVGSLTLKIDNLEDVLAGVTNADLNGVVNTLEGISKGELSGALGKLAGVGDGQLGQVVDGLPVLSTICPQTKAVTEQANKLGTALGGFGLNGILTNLGGVLTVPAAPTALTIPTCPS